MMCKIERYLIWGRLWTLKWIKMVKRKSFYSWCAWEKRIFDCKQWTLRYIVSSYFAQHSLAIYHIAENEIYYFREKCTEIYLKILLELFWPSLQYIVTHCDSDRKHLTQNSFCSKSQIIPKKNKTIFRCLWFVGIIILN